MFCKRLAVALGSLVAASSVWAAPFAYVPNAGAGANSVTVIDAATNAVATTIAGVGSDCRGVAVSPDGAKVYLACRASGRVDVIDTATNTSTPLAGAGGLNAPTGIAINPAGTKLYVTEPRADNLGNTVAVIDITTTPATFTRVTVGAAPIGITASADGARVFAANSNGLSVSVIDAATNTVTTTIITGGFAISGVAVNSAGTRAYVTNRTNSNTVTVIDTTTNTVASTILIPSSGPFGVAVNNDGSRVYVANELLDRVSIIDAATNTVVGNIAVGDKPQGLAFTSTGDKLFVANADSDNVSIVDTATNTVVATLAAGDGPIALGKFVAPVPTVALAITPAGPIDFGIIVVGTSSTPQNVTLANIGNVAVTISNIATSDPQFSLAASDCGALPATLAAGASCTQPVVFQPGAVANPLNGTLTITSSAPDSPVSIALTGIAAANPAADVRPDPTTLTFADQAVATTSAAQTVTITNLGDATAINLVVTTGAPFVLGGNTCPSNLPDRTAAPANTCTVTVQFAPTALGAAAGTLTITADPPAVTNNVTLSGNGAPTPLLSLSASTLDFGTVRRNTTSAAQTLTITNNGGADLAINSITPAGEYALDAATSTCGATVAAAASCAIGITFTPTATGARNGTLTLNTNDPATPSAVVTLTGSGRSRGNGSGGCAVDRDGTADLGFALLAMLAGIWTLRRKLKP